LVQRLHRSFPRAFAARSSSTRARSVKRLHSKIGEHLVIDPQLVASVQATTPTSEPLAVKEVRAGHVGSDHE
jgi:hypothetical protein